LSIERAKAYLNDPLIQAFEKQSKEAIYAAFESANERDTEHLKNLCLAAKANKRFFSYLQSFLETEKVQDFHKQGGIVDSVTSLLRRNTK
jgi:membrane-anchored protein YejM (alkaline phosphatase superfamily)